MAIEPNQMAYVLKTYFRLDVKVEKPYAFLDDVNLIIKLVELDSYGQDGETVLESSTRIDIGE